MKAGPHPALAQGKVRYVGDHVAVVIADTLAEARDAAELVDGRLRGAAGLRRYRHHAGRRQAAGPRGGAQQHGLSVAPRRQGGHRCRLRRRQARHQDRPRQQPADPQRHGAARGDRRVRRRQRGLHALHHQPEPARGAAGAVGLHRHRARAQAARDRAGRRRRLRLQDLHLRRGDRVRVGGQEGRPAGEVDRATARRPSSPTRTAATTSPTPSWPWTPAARSWRCGPTPRPTSAAICRRSPPRCRPISTRRCCRASTTSRPSTARSTASTPTPRRSMPIAAPAGRKRPSWSSG